MQDTGNKSLTRFEALMLFVAAAATNLLLPYLSALLVRIGIPSGVAQTASAAVFYAGLVALPAVLAHKKGDAYGLLRLGAPSIPQVLFTCLIAYFGVRFVTFLSALWTAFIEMLGGTLPYDSAPVPTSLNGLITSLILSAMVPGVAEELFFRGAVLRGLEESEPPKRAIFACGLLFACLHGSIGGFPAEICVGCALGYLVYITDSLYTAVICHTLHNTLILVESYRAGPTAGPSSATMTEAIEAAGGFGAFIAVTLLMGIVYLYLLRKFGRLFGGERRIALRTRRGRNPFDLFEMIVAAVCAVAALCLLVPDLGILAGWFG